MLNWGELLIGVLDGSWIGQIRKFSDLLEVNHRFRVTCVGNRRRFNEELPERNKGDVKQSHRKAYICNQI